MTGVVAARTDISALQEEWSSSRLVFESISAGVVIADAREPDMPLVYVNPAFERMTGYALDEVRGRDCLFLQGAGTDGEDLGLLRRALADGRGIEMVLKSYRKDGAAFWNELQMSPIRDATGRVTHCVGLHKDVTARVEAQSKLTHMAHHDGMTGLANRNLLMERMEQALLRARRSERVVGALFFDLDDFKRVNDAVGHEGGDTMLRAVAERLRSGTRAYETVARLGGDEFVVLLEELGEEHEAGEIMQRLKNELGRPLTISGQEFRPSASVGMGLYPRDGKTAKELLRAADVAMYAAKHRRAERQNTAARCSGVPEYAQPEYVQPEYVQPEYVQRG